MESPVVIRQALGEESMSRMRVFEWHTQFRADQTIETGEEQGHRFFLLSRGLFTKNLPWQAKQPIPHPAATSYGNCVKMCKDCLVLWRQKNWLLHQDNAFNALQSRQGHFTLPFSPGNF
jgi:hypothetical protein